MKMSEYQKLASATRNKNLTDDQRIMNGLLGILGEGGEVADIIKKHRFQGHALDTNAIVDELGDVLWYIAELAGGLGVTLEHVARHNIEKLKARYPDGFSAEASINRSVSVKPTITAEGLETLAEIFAKPAIAAKALETLALLQD